MNTPIERARARDLALALTLALAGCASGPREKDLLPDEGPTTLEVYERHLSGFGPAETGDAPAAPARGDGPPGSAPWPPGRERPDRARRPSPEPALRPIRATWVGEPAAPDADAESRSGLEALNDLRRDFQRVPNPDILGYVYPHLRGELPVPGYYTSFPLRERAHYAEPGEGAYPGVGP